MKYAAAHHIVYCRIIYSLYYVYWSKVKVRLLDIVYTIVISSDVCIELVTDLIQFLLIYDDIRRCTLHCLLLNYLQSCRVKFSLVEGKG